MVPCVLKAGPACSEPPAAGISMRMSTGEIGGFGESAPVSNRMSPMLCSGAEDSAEPSELIRLIGSSLPGTDNISIYILFGGTSSLRCESSCLEIRLPSRRDVAAEPEAAIQRDADYSCS